MSSGTDTSAAVLTGLDVGKPARPDASVLLRIGLGLTRACDLHCIYCLADAGGCHFRPLEMGEYDVLLRQAQQLGLRTVVLIGEGEPLCFPGLPALLAIIAGAGLTPVLFTNGQQMSAPLAESLWRSGASVVLKLNSLDYRVHDQLVGADGAYERARKALDLLLKYSFASGGTTRLAIQAVITTLNVNSVGNLWLFCRSRGILPYFETLRRCGRARARPDLVVARNSLKVVYEDLAALDRERFGLSWEAHPPYVGRNCQQHFYSCFVRANGDVSPCSGIPLVTGNVRRSPLRAILQQPPFRRLRSMPASLTGRCSACRMRHECYGCRANAFACGNLFGDDPDCWI